MCMHVHPLMDTNDGDSRVQAGFQNKNRTRNNRGFVFVINENCRTEDRSFKERNDN